MAIVFDAEPVPLCRDEHGDIRIGGSRVLLDLVVHAFDSGATPETIVQMYPTLKLADVYGTISYCLRHRQDVDAYLRERNRRAEAIRRKVEAGQEAMSQVRARLLKRRAEAGLGDAATSE